MRLSFAQIATNSNPEAIVFRQTVDDLNTFMADQRLPGEMQIKLRRYFHQRKNLQMMSKASEVVGKLSSSLQVEVVMHCHGYWLKEVSFLQDVESGFLVQVARMMLPIVFSPYELPPQRTLYVVRSGLVLRASRVISAGQVYGEDVCVDGPPDEMSVTSRCMTYVEVLALTQGKLRAVVGSFVRAAKRVRRIEIKYLITRAIRRIMRQAVELARQQAELRGESPSSSALKPRDFVSRLVDASSNEARQALLSGHAQVQIDEPTTGSGSSEWRLMALESDMRAVRQDLKHVLCILQSSGAPSSAPWAAPAATPTRLAKTTDDDLEVSPDSVSAAVSETACRRLEHALSSMPPRSRRSDQ